MTERDNRIVELYIELGGIEPLVWRRIQVPADFPLRRLHDTIQAVFDWWDNHLHQFEVGGRIYGQPEIVDEDFYGERFFSDKNVKVSALLDRGVTEFLYRYDFGDDWEHRIAIEAMIDPEEEVEYPVLIDGARQAPPDDCGGPPGYEVLIEAVDNPEHDDHEFLLDWVGGEFDPEDMNLDTVEAMLSRIRASRRKGPPKGRPSSSKKIWMKTT